MDGEAVKYRISELITLLCLISLVALPWFVLLRSPDWKLVAGAAAWWGVLAMIAAVFNKRYT